MKTFCIFLVQKSLIDNTVSLEDTDQDTLPHKYGEPIKVYTKHTSTVSSSFAGLVSTSQSGENALPFCDVTLILSNFSFASFDVSCMTF